MQSLSNRTKLLQTFLNSIDSSWHQVFDDELVNLLSIAIDSTLNTAVDLPKLFKLFRLINFNDLDVIFIHSYMSKYSTRYNPCYADSVFYDSTCDSTIGSYHPERSQDFRVIEEAFENNIPFNVAFSYSDLTANGILSLPLYYIYHYTTNMNSDTNTKWLEFNYALYSNIITLKPHIILVAFVSNQIINAIRVMKGMIICQPLTPSCLLSGYKANGHSQFKHHNNPIIRHDILTKINQCLVSANKPKLFTRTRNKIYNNEQ